MENNYKQIFSQLNVDMYVSRLDNDELLYISDNIKNTIPLDVLANFCKGFKSYNTNTIEREFKYDNNVYLCRGAKIFWNGELAHIEYIQKTQVKKELLYELALLREEKSKSFIQFDPIEKDLTKTSDKLIGTVKFNLTKNYITDHKIGTEGNPGYPDFTPINEFFRLIAPPGSKDDDTKEFVDHFSAHQLIEAKKNKDTVVHEYHRLIRPGIKIWCKTIAIFLDAKEGEDEVALICTYNIDEAKLNEKIQEYIVNTNFDFVALIDIQNEIGKTTIKYVSKYTDETYSDLYHFKINASWDYETELQKFINLDSNKNRREDLTNSLCLSTIIERLEEYQVYSYIYTINGRQDGNHKHARFSYLTEEKTKIVYTLTDVTDVYEKEMRIKAELSKAIQLANEANQAKSNFLARISHDMRTPMNSILGFARLGKEEESILEKNQYFTHITEAGEHLLGLINDVLFLRKIEEDKLVLDIQPVQLNEMDEYVQTVVSQLANEKKIKLIIKRDNKYESLMYDKLRMKQILINLVSNAIKFTPSGGKVIIEISESEPRENNTIIQTIKIHDTGIGMTPDFVKHHLYTPFEQENRLENALECGTGLGMSIVKTLVLAMSGSIDCDSVLGKGTTFTIQLPILISKTSPLKREDENKISYDILVGKRILLCEDHLLNIKIAEKILTKKGITVEIASNGKFGLEMLKNSTKNYYDAILMDIRMPVMDGLEATKAIRSSNHPNATSIPIIAMSANAYDDDKRLSISVGMNDHLSKPIDVNLLYSTLTKLISENTNK